MPIISLFKKPVLIFGIIYFILLIFLFHPRISGNDGVGYYVYLRSAILDSDFDFTNEFQHYQDTYLIVGYNRITGKPVNGLPVGSAILWLPFFLIAHLFVWVINFFGFSIPMDGYSLPYVYLVCFGSSVYGLIGLLLICQIAKQIFCGNDKPITVSLILFWLASPLVFYMYLQPVMAHANAVFTVSLFIFLWYKWRNQESRKKWLWLGLSGSLMTLVRFQDAIFLLIPWLDYFIVKTEKIKVKHILINISIFLFSYIILLIPQLIAWKSIFGSYFSGPESHNIISGTNIFTPHLIAILFSGRHGLITWNPIILCSLLGAVWLWKKDKRVTWLLGIIFILQLYLISCWHEWWGAHSFGHRMFLSSTPFFVLGLISFLNWVTQKVSWRWIYIIGVLLIIWNFFLIAQYSLGIIDRDGTTPFITVIYNQFYVVPFQLRNIVIQIFS